MKKLLLFCLIAAVLLTACGAPSDDDDRYNPNRSDVSDAQVELSLESVLMLEVAEVDTENTVSFNVSLTRPDLGLQQPVNESKEMGDYIFTSDLAPGLQPRVMYVSDVNDTVRDSGNSCYRPVFPHECSMSVSADDYAKGQKTYLVKILFEDDSYAASEITVPFPEKLFRPEISEPESVPKQGSAFDMTFKDVGADDYRVEMNLCHPYENDGINPCLDGVEYSFERKSGVLVDATYDPLYPVTIEIQGDLIHLSSEFPLYFSESVIYTVVAEKSSEVGDGVSSVTESHDMKSFEI